MKCTSFNTFDKNGKLVIKPKRPYESLEEAKQAAYALNRKLKPIRQLEAYKCEYCNKYHIGRGKGVSNKKKKKFKR